MVKSIYESGKIRKEFAEKHGYTLDELDRMKFIVTAEGEPMVLIFTTSDTSKQVKFMKKNNIVPAVMYDGSFTGITIGFQTWNGQDNGVFEKYLSDATVGRTTEQCVEEIVKDSGNDIRFVL